MSDNKLSPDQLSKVSGGYIEEDILSPYFEKNIECPICHATSKDTVILDISTDILDKGTYYCKTCKKHFDPIV